MNTVFIGGSRHVSRLPIPVKERLNNVIKNGHQVVVGDANGADKAVQKHFLDASYEKVTVFCSGEHARNNLGQWQTQNITPPKNAKGFQFYAAKDREMAQSADFGLMIWDGKSPGTVLNVLRLVRAGKIAVLINIPEKTPITIKSVTQWDEFLSQCSTTLRADLRDRATADEWEPTGDNHQGSFLDEPKKPDQKLHSVTESPSSESEDKLAATINAALASGDPTSFVDALGNLARARGMTQVAKDAGLARESLYRSLGNGGNPEFATVLRVMAAVGLRLEASKTHPE
jgi:probable addiction module antidote protein